MAGAIALYELRGGARLRLSDRLASPQSGETDAAYCRSTGSDRQGGAMEPQGRVERRWSRATLLRRAGVLGAAAAVPTGRARRRGRDSAAARAARVADGGRGGRAGCDARPSIPTDASGPVREARVLRYIDRALDGELAPTVRATRPGSPRSTTTPARGSGRGSPTCPRHSRTRFFARSRTPPPVSRRLAGLLRPRAGARVAGDVRRPLPRRQRRLRRLGPARVHRDPMVYTEAEQQLDVAVAGPQVRRRLPARERRTRDGERKGP